MELPHITNGINTNKASDNADNYGHNNRKLVDENIIFDFDIMQMRALEPEHQNSLGGREQKNQRPAIADGEINNVYANGTLDV
jgi:hypothetical protein